MTLLEERPVVQEAEPNEGGDSFCHLVYEDEDAAMCGVRHSMAEVGCETFDSAESVSDVCPSCGHPTCPRCLRVLSLYAAVDQ